MPNPINLGASTGAASSTKGMHLSIQIHGDEFINMDSRPMPAFYSTLECPAVFRATVTLETAEKCVGNDVEIIFNTCAPYKAPGIDTMQRSKNSRCASLPLCDED